MRQALDLVRDLLDTQVLDHEQHALGKVDGIGLELREGAPPCVAYLEVDGVTAWRRLGGRVGRWAARIAGGWQREGHPYRLRWSQVRALDIDLEIDAAAESSPALDLERWLRDKLVRHIPGGA
jgi:hypothetical protein